LFTFIYMYATQQDAPHRNEVSSRSKERLQVALSGFKARDNAFQGYRRISDRSVAMATGLKA
jgi:hypothetical protein